jgi:hypothetical protein
MRLWEQLWNCRDCSVLLNKRALVIALLVDMMLGKCVFAGDSSSKHASGESAVPLSVDDNENLERTCLEGQRDSRKAGWRPTGQKVVLVAGSPKQDSDRSGMVESNQKQRTSKDPFALN